MSELQTMEAGALKAKIAEGGAVLVDIWASWCGPCKAMMPTLETVARERNGKLEIVKLEINNSETPQNDEWTKQFGVRSVPTFILFRAGADIGGFTGSATQAELCDWLDEQLA